MSTKMDDIAEDILVGADAIAAHIRKTKRQTFYLLETKQIPAFKLARAWHMRKSSYRTHIEQLEAAAMRDAGGVR
jgi:hypothetical protein